ncbi:MAG: UbiX family flavin prenyltransferase [Myxococcota bacterium]|nr:UbiX family flavin prenyltransferase [Myxococcota bacterium]
MDSPRRRGPPRRYVVGISGASGVACGVRLLEKLRGVPGVETHLVLSRNAERVLRIEAGPAPRAVRALATRSYDPDDLAAPIASGSFRTAGMVIAPCSIKTLSAVANCHAADLLARSADVTLKERRPLVLLVRETPLHVGQIRQMLLAAEAGAIVMPLVPAFYARPTSIEDIVDQTAGRILDLLGINDPVYRRWPGGGTE